MARIDIGLYQVYWLLVFAVSGCGATSVAKYEAQIETNEKSVENSDLKFTDNVIGNIANVLVNFLKENQAEISKHSDFLPSEQSLNGIREARFFSETNTTVILIGDWQLRVLEDGSLAATIRKIYGDKFNPSAEAVVEVILKNKKDTFEVVDWSAYVDEFEVEGE